MYDKSIHLELGLYWPVVREGAFILPLEPCHTLSDAQRVLAALPPDCGDGSFASCAVVRKSTRSEWFAEKLAREDEFENFLAKAEECR